MKTIYLFLLVSPALLLGSGCSSLSVSMPEAGSARNDGVLRKAQFRVASMDGSIRTGFGKRWCYFGGTEAEETALTPASVNEALRQVRPDLFDEEDSIPVSIRVGGGMKVTGGSMSPFAALLYWTSVESEFPLIVQLYREDGTPGRKQTAVGKATFRCSVTPAALCFSDREDRPTSRNVGYDMQKYDALADKVVPRLAAMALAKELDRLTDDEIVALSKTVPLTVTEVTNRRRMEEENVETVRLGKDAAVVSHAFQGVEETKPSGRTRPAVLVQNYDSRTARVMVMIDETGFDGEASSDYAKLLVSRICETKATVLDLGSLPPPGAAYRIVSDEEVKIFNY